MSKVKGESLVYTWWLVVVVTSTVQGSATSSRTVGTTTDYISNKTLDAVVTKTYHNIIEDHPENPSLQMGIVTNVSFLGKATKEEFYES